MKNVTVLKVIAPNSVVLYKLMPWSNHYFLKISLKFASSFYRGSELIYACPQRLMDPTGFWNTCRICLALLVALLINSLMPGIWPSGGHVLSGSSGTLFAHVLLDSLVYG